MKIAYLSDSLLPSKRANSIHVMHMCYAFHQNGHEVVLYGLGKISKSTEDIYKWYGVENFKISLTKLRLPKLTLYWNAHRILGSVKKDNPDLIFGRSLFSCSLLAKHGYDVLFETHDPYSTLNDKQKLAFRQMLNSGHLKGIVVLSGALKRILLKEIPELDDRKILAVHDGATSWRISESQLNTYPWPCFTGERLQIGYVGTISPGRGVEIILDLAKNFPNHDFHIIGGEKNDLEQLDLGLRVPSSNLFFHGFVSPKNAAFARKKCDILLAPYQKNVTIRSGKNTADYMSPLKIFEYMESGKPIISSDLPVLREILEDEANALLVSSNKIKEWKNSVTRLIEDEKLREILGTRAQNDLQSKFSWKIRADKILNFADTGVG